MPKRDFRQLIIVLALIFSIPLILVGQNSLIIASGTLPATCSVGGVYLKTGATNPGFYYCFATDTWHGPLTVSSAGVQSWLDDVRQTFNPGANAAGLNVGSQAGDPGTPSNGDVWYDSTANELTARINGANVALGAGGGGGTVTHRFGWTWSGTSLTTGTHPFFNSMQAGGTIVRVRLWADVSCSAVVDLWLDDYAAFPPTNADAIAGTDEPELTSDLTFEDTTFTNYSATTFTAGDVFGANVDSVSGCSTLQLQVDWEE